jgi:hypothetical protein
MSGIACIPKSVSSSFSKILFYIKHSLRTVNIMHVLHGIAVSALCNVTDPGGVSCETWPTLLKVLICFFLVLLLPFPLLFQKLDIFVPENSAPPYVLVGWTSSIVYGLYVRSLKLCSSLHQVHLALLAIEVVLTILSNSYWCQRVLLCTLLWVYTVRLIFW